MEATTRPAVATSLGNLPIDSSGTPVVVARTDPHEAYVGVPLLLQTFINENSAEAWNEIRTKVDNTFTAVDRALSELEKATGFAARVQSEVAKGKKVLFKPNLVYPACIDPTTHGPDAGDKACTDWTFVAAVMRWFHDRLGITYHQMCVGEGGTGSAGVPNWYTMHWGNGRTITNEAVTEGKSGDFYGGWGFYFARKYLADTHDPSHTDDPMRGHAESAAGTYIPPGRATDKLMAYDTNRTYDEPSKEREVSVPDGSQYKTISLHKVLTGGNPADPDDLKDYPGCVLVNLPKLKIHDVALITCAVKNLGIGLYPMQAAEHNGTAARRWKYGTPPNAAVPFGKGGIPHRVWRMAVDPKTGQPLKDDQGKTVFNRTDGIHGTMADVIRAVESCGTMIIHVVDGIECINLDHKGIGVGVKVLEGLVFAGLNPVAVDVTCARYMFKTVPMAEARRLKETKNLPGEFLQRVPIPRYDGQNIVAEEGYDSPIYRSHEAEYMEKRGLGGRDCHVIGWDLLARAPMASVQGHLGRVEAGRFVEIMTGTTYMDVPKLLWDMQEMVMGYVKVADEMSGTSYRDAILQLFDDNGDGVLDIDERGKSVMAPPGIVQAEMIRATEEFGFLRGFFWMGASSLKLRRASWNPNGAELPKPVLLDDYAYAALQLSQSSEERADPFVSGLTYGKGKWPSLPLVEHLTMLGTLYGPDFPEKVAPDSVYGLAVAYADKVLNGATFTGSKGLATDKEAVEKYIAAVTSGAKPLDFTLYVPMGWADMGKKLPNIEETADATKVLTASFGGKEVW